MKPNEPAVTEREEEAQALVATLRADLAEAMDMPVRAATFVSTIADVGLAAYQTQLAVKRAERAEARAERLAGLLAEAVRNINAMATRNTPWETWASDFSARVERALEDTEARA